MASVRSYLDTITEDCGYRTADSPPPVRRHVPDRRNHQLRERLLQRIRDEFDELRGLTLTFRQAARLFGLREDICRRVLGELIAEDLLRRTAEDSYVRKWMEP